MTSIIPFNIYVLLPRVIDTYIHVLSGSEIIDFCCSQTDVAPSAWRCHSLQSCIIWPPMHLHLPTVSPGTYLKKMLDQFYEGVGSGELGLLPVLHATRCVYVCVYVRVCTCVNMCVCVHVYYFCFPKHCYYSSLLLPCALRFQLWAEELDHSTRQGGH